MPEHTPGKGIKVFQPPITPDVNKGLQELEKFKQQVNTQKQEKGKR